MGTLTHLEDIEAPIHRVDLKLKTAHGGQVVSILAISTDEIGFRHKASDKVMAAIGKFFNVDHHRSLANPHGPIDLLIGLEDQKLLLKEMDRWPKDGPYEFRSIYKSIF